MSTLKVQERVPLAPLTTLRLGGPALYFTAVNTEAELLEAFRWARDGGVPVAILAGGSNVIVPDEGFPGLVVHMRIGGLSFNGDGRVTAGAGVPWDELVSGAVERDWAGVECLSGIPGSAGAAMVQNAGAYSQAVSAVVVRVRALCRDTLTFVELDAASCEFGYRDSAFKRNPARYVVCQVEIKLHPGKPPTVSYSDVTDRAPADPTLGDVRAVILDIRRDKSMVISDEGPPNRTVGSFFVNPVLDGFGTRELLLRLVNGAFPNITTPIHLARIGKDHRKVSAAWLIQAAGFPKGFRRGPVGVSSKHALALVHHGGGRTADLLALATEIEEQVYDRLAVRLTREPRILC